MNKMDIFMLITVPLMFACIGIIAGLERIAEAIRGAKR